jgi:glycosyltransferase involved in cell wall biosynthesis
MKRAPEPTDLRAIVALASHIHHEQPDIVHAHSSKAGVIAAAACLLRRKPCVYTPHAWSFQMDTSVARRSAYVAVERVSARLGHRRIVAVAASERAIGVARRILPAHRIHVVHTGLPRTSGVPRSAARARLGIEDDTLVAGWVGRDAAQKRPGDLIPLARALARRGVSLLALGDDLAHREPRLIASGGRLAPAGTSPSMVYAASDLLVHTSAWEGFPLTILEALSAGLVVVAYDIDGVSEQIRNGETGFLVPCGDITALADRAGQIAHDPWLRRRMSRRAAGDVGVRFAADRWVDRLEQIYCNVLDQGTRR